MSDIPKAGIIRILSTEDNANRIWNPLRIGFLLTMLAAILIAFALAFTLVYCVVHKIALPERIGEYCTGVGVIFGGIGTLIGGTGAGLWADAKAPSS